MDHLAKAQVSYLRTVSELREKITKLEAYHHCVLNIVERNLSILGETITDQLSQVADLPNRTKAAGPAALA